MNEYLKERQSLFSKGETPEGVFPSELFSIHEQKQFLENDIAKSNKVLEMLHLTKYYPQKLTIRDSLMLRQDTLESIYALSELLPYCILQKIIMLHYTTRSCLPCQSSSLISDASSEDVASDGESEVESEDGSLVHPMDGLLAILYCSDNFLRQKLFAKLSTSQLAVPLLLPDSCTQTLTLSLWAMRSIVKEWKCKSTTGGEIITMQHRIVDHKAPIVTFVRFSECTISKSKIMNDVIGDSRHDFFFHYDSEGCSTPRVFVDGLVEVCWYLPSGDQYDPFPDAVAFTNLHGDARHHDMQIAFLSQLSFMFCVLLSGQDLSGRSITVLQQLAKTPGGVVLMFSDSIDKELPIPQGKYRKIHLRKKNAASVKSIIWKHIKMILGSGSGNFLAISESSEIAYRIGIHVDEEDPECIKGRELAYATLRGVLGESTTCVKENMLPLQSRQMWQKWAKDDKEQHRHEKRGWKGISEYTSEKEQDKRIIHQEQLKVAEHPTALMQSFLQTLQTHEGSTRNYFLEWLRLLLDDLSQQALPTLWSDYQSKRMELQQLKEKTGEGKHLTSLKDEEWELYQRLVFASIGLEHLFRELGQVYEAVTTRQMDDTQESLYGRLPQIATELLLAGYPLELMDGDAGHIPMKWVNTVLDKVKEQLGDVRLFVLSVLGVQSSGISTLLNTMFGLQFVVGAGRSTRGAFIQLLPLDEKVTQEVLCDYVLVVNTEGLRVSEIDPHQAQKHDNEMATFLIGLADVVIINIMGEASGDILRTAMHAFRQLKKVRVYPRIQFVHQNVAAVSACSKATFKLHENLDALTKTVAREEKFDDQYTSFKDVIRKADVLYFPALHKGDLPMAPVNLGYSDAACRLRSGLIHILRTRRSLCSLSEFQTLINYLWKTLLQEKFVFSFKSTLEFSCYKLLDAQYCRWSWILQKGMIEWKQRAENMIGSSDVKDLPTLAVELTRDRHLHAASVFEYLKKAMKDFSNDQSCEPDVIAQWQYQTELRLEEMHEELQLQAEKHCKALIASRQTHERGEKLQVTYRSRILDQVKKLVSDLGDKQLSEDEQESLFEEKWTKWLQELTADMPDKIDLDYIDIEASIATCLECRLEPYRGLIIKNLHNNPLHNQRSLKMAIDKDIHIISCRWHGFIGLQSVVRAQSGTDMFLAKAKRYLEDLRRKIQNFKEAFVDELLRDLMQSIKDFEDEELYFRFTPYYRVDIALVVCGYAVHKFKDMMKKFTLENDPIEYLKRKKESFLSAFKSSFSQCGQEKAAADNLCSLLAKPIEAAVIGSLAPIIVQDMKVKSSSFHTKKSLKAKILRDLAEKDDFALYMAYLSDPSQVIQDQIKLYTEEHCKGEGETSRLAQLAEVKISEIIHLISGQRVAVPETETIDISDWLDEFHTRVRGQLKLKRREILEFLGVETAQEFDYKFFTDELKEGILSLQQDLNKTFQASPATLMKSWSQRPHDLMYQSLIGCTEQCPFCKEQCELSNPKHVDKHSIELHRPDCLGGVHRQRPNEMLLEICNVNVATDRQFWFEENNCRRFKDYQTYYPKWSITPDLSLEASSYWKWFIAKYSDKFIEHFGMLETIIPQSWKDVTWEIVKEDLERLDKNTDHNQGLENMDEMQQSHHSKILHSVEVLVSEFTDKELSEAEQESLFEEKWIGWLQKLTVQSPKVCLVNVEAAIERCLKRQLKPYYGLVLKYLDEKPLRNQRCLKMMVEKDIHMVSHRWHGLRGLQSDDVVRAQSGTDMFLAKAKRYLEDLTRKIQNFKERFVDELLRDLIKSINDFEEVEANTFGFTVRYKVNIALVVCGYALHEFEAMQKRFKDKDPIDYLKRNKESFLCTFKNIYSGCIQEKVAATRINAATELTQRVPTMDQYLQNNGLLPTKWEPLFVKAGITKPEHILVVSGSFDKYTALSADATEEEKEALRKLLNISEQKVATMDRYLQNNGLPPTKWEPLFVKAGITKPEHILVVSGSFDKYTALSADATEEEKEALRKLLNISEQEVPTMDRYLQNNGLPPTKWEPLFVKAGITKPEHILVVSGSFDKYTALSADATEEEKEALRKLLNISEQKVATMDRYLQNNGLSPTKWEPLFVKAGITKPEHVLVVSGSFDKYTALSADATEEEKEALRKLLNISEQEVPTMNQYLQNNGLPPTKWEPLFVKAGITKPEHILVVSGSFDKYTALSADATEEEKEALRKLLNISEQEVPTMDRYLQNNGLPPTKWEPLFVKAGITKPEHILVVSGSFDKYTALSADATEEEKEALRKLLNISEQKVATMDRYLQNNGLPPTKWEPLFVKAGITKPEHVLVVSGSFEKYTALSADATEEEKEALRKLLNISKFETKPQMHELMFKYGVIESTEAKWKNLAYALYLEDHTVETIDHDAHGKAREACKDVLSRWLDGQGERGPRNWATLLEVLRVMNKTELAKDISCKLCKK